MRRSVAAAILALGLLFVGVNIAAAAPPDRPCPSRAPAGHGPPRCAPVAEYTVRGFPAEVIVSGEYVPFEVRCDPGDVVRYGYGQNGEAVYVSVADPSGAGTNAGQFRYIVTRLQYDASSAAGYVICQDVARPFR